MKLYTEEQVIKAMMLCTNQRIGFTTILQEHLKPIELPSDEDIERKIEYRIDKEFKAGSLAFRDGAKWMRNKIEGGNK
jgi:hypothetical protein